MTADVMDLVVDRSLWRGADKRFLAVLGGSMAVHFVLAALVMAQPARPAEEPLQPATQRSYRLRLPPPATPKETRDLKAVATPSRPSAHAHRGLTSHAAEALKSEGLLGIIGSESADGHGLAEDVLGGSPSLNEALDGATHRIASLDELGVRKDSGPVTERIALTTDGVGKVKLGEKGTRAPPKPPTIIFDPPVVPKDLTGLTEFIAHRKKALQYCYERELPRSPTLHGRLLVRLTLDGPGRAADVEVSDEGLGSDGVASCVRTLIRSWNFPFDVNATVELPFMFSRVP